VTGEAPGSGDRAAPVALPSADDQIFQAKKRRKMSSEKANYRSMLFCCD
jgi:hypothetical protein